MRRRPYTSTSCAPACSYRRRRPSSSADRPINCFSGMLLFKQYALQAASMSRWYCFVRPSAARVSTNPGPARVAVAFSAHSRVWGLSTFEIRERQQQRLAGCGKTRPLPLLDNFRIRSFHEMNLDSTSDGHTMCLDGVAGGYGDGRNLSGDVMPRPTAMPTATLGYFNPGEWRAAFCALGGSICAHVCWSSRRYKN